SVATRSGLLFGDLAGGERKQTGLVKVQQKGASRCPHDTCSSRKEVNLRNNTIVPGVVLVMLMSAATGVGNAEAAAGAGFGVQAIQTAPSTDKRAEALKKYLEAKRLDQAGNYP